MASPFMCFDASGMDNDWSFQPIDYKKEELKRYVRTKAYLPPMGRHRSIPYTGRADATLFSKETGILFAKRRHVSFNDTIQMFVYAS